MSLETTEITTPIPPWRESQENLYRLLYPVAEFLNGLMTSVQASDPDAKKSVNLLELVGDSARGDAVTLNQLLQWIADAIGVLDSSSKIRAIIELAGTGIGEGETSADYTTFTDVMRSLKPLKGSGCSKIQTLFNGLIDASGDYDDLGTQLRDALVALTDGRLRNPEFSDIMSLTGTTAITVTKDSAEVSACLVKGLMFITTTTVPAGLQLGILSGTDYVVPKFQVSDTANKIFQGLFVFPQPLLCSGTLKIKAESGPVDVQVRLIHTAATV